MRVSCIRVKQKPTQEEHMDKYVSVPVRVAMSFNVKPLRCGTKFSRRVWSDFHFSDVTDIVSFLLSIVTPN